MFISDWLSQQGISQTDFARSIGVTSNAVCQWCKGERIPRKKEMEQIYRGTRGQVAPNDFYNLPKLESEDVAA